MDENGFKSSLIDCLIKNIPQKITTIEAYNEYCRGFGAISTGFDAALFEIFPESDIGRLIEKLAAKERWDIIFFIINQDLRYIDVLSTCDVQRLAKFLVQNPFNNWDPFYTVIRLGSRELLEELIYFKKLEKKDKNKELAHVLAQNMEHLKLRKVQISTELENYIQEILISTRFIKNFYVYKSEIISYNDRKNFIIDIIDKLCNEYSNSVKVDDIFLFQLRFIAKNMLILDNEKKFLKKDKDINDYWKEREFLLGIFIASICKQRNAEFVVPFSIKDVLGFVKNSSNIKQIYDLVRSMHALTRIQYYIKLVKNCKIENNETVGRLLMERSLQVTGEYLNSKNIPKNVEVIFNQQHTPRFFETVRNLRHSVTHNRNINAISNQDFNMLKKELQRIFPHIFNFLYMEQFELLEQLVGSNFNSQPRIKYVDNFLSNDLLSSLMMTCNDNIVIDPILEHFMGYNSSKIVIERFVSIIKNIYNVDIVRDLYFKNSKEVQDKIRALVKAFTGDVINYKNLENLNKTLTMFDESKSITNAIEKLIMKGIIKKAIKSSKNNIRRASHNEKIKIFQNFQTNSNQDVKLEIENTLIDEGIIPNIKYFKDKFKTLSIKCIGDIDNDDTKLAACEMLSLHLLEYFCSESLLNIRVRFIDDYYPIAFGSQLRNHLAHINSAFENLPNTSAIHFVLNHTKLFERKSEHIASISLQEFKDRYATCEEIITTQNDLFRASSAGNLQKFKECVSKGADIAGVNFEGCTVLELAAHTDENKVFAYLLQNRLADFQTSRLFEILIRNNNINNLKLLWNMGAKIQHEEKMNGLSYLHLAVVNWHEEIAKRLLDNGADIESKGVNDLTPLHLAVLINSSDGVKFLLEQGANAEARDVNGNSIIHIAAIFGYHDLLPIFKKKSFDLINKLKRTPLHIAVANGHQQFVTSLIKTVDIKSADEGGKTAIHYAAENGHRVNFNLLLQRTSEPAARSKEGDTILHLAAYNGHEEIVEDIFENKVIAGDLKNGEGNTALHLAAQQNHTSIVQYLVKKGVNINLINNYFCFAFELSEDDVIKDILRPKTLKIEYKPSLYNKLNNDNIAIFEMLKNNSTRKTCLEIIASMQAEEITEEIENLVDISDEERTSMLHRAAFYGRTEILRNLMKNNVTVDSIKNGVTAFHLAALKGQPDSFKILLENDKKDTLQKNKNVLQFATINCNLDVMKILLKRGADVNFHLDNDLTAMDIAALNGHFKAMKLLFQYNAKIDTKNTTPLGTAYEKTTSLHLAVIGGQKSCVEILLNKKAEIEAKDAQKWTPLHVAVLFGNQECVEILLSKNANIEAQAENLRTPLHIAAAEGHKSCVQNLLEKNANIDTEDDKKATPLHLSAYFGNQDCLEILLSKNANIEAKDENLRTPLHIAAAEGHKSCVQSLLEKNANIEAEDEIKATPLHLSAYFGNQDCLEILLSKNANIEAKDENLHTPLHIAAAEGHKSCVQSLLEKNANIEAEDEIKATPLHLSAYFGNQDCLEILLSKNANIEAKDENLHTPLHIAAAKGHKSCVQSLLEKNANIEAENEKKRTPLHLSAYFGNQDCLEILLSKNANIEAKDENLHTPLYIAAAEGHKSCVQSLLEKNANIEAENEKKRTPLHLSAYFGNQDCLEILLSKNANIEAKDENLRTPLHIAAAEGHKSCVQSLLEKNANIEAEDEIKATPLHLSAYFGNQDCLEILLSKNANIEAKDENLHTPLHIAAAEGHKSCVQSLLEKNANIEAEDEIKATPLHLSAYFGNQDCLEILLSKNANIEAKDENLRTPLHIAAAEGHKSCVQSLLEKNANIEAEDEIKATPLHLSAYFGNQDCLEILLSKNANIEAKDENLRTPLHIAAAEGHKSCVQSLLEKKANIEAEDYYKNTPLHFAAFFGHSLTIAKLLENNANRHAKNKLNQTPLDFAIEKGHLWLIFTNLNPIQ